MLRERRWARERRCPGFFAGGGEEQRGVLSRSYAMSAPADRDPSQLDYSCLIIVGVDGGGGGGKFRFSMQYVHHAVGEQRVRSTIQLTCNCDQRYDEVIRN